MTDTAVAPDDVAYRLVHPNLWLAEQHRPMSSLFRGDGTVSVFLASRLPEPPDACLNMGRFASFGRLALSVAELRALDAGIDVVLDPEGAFPPFEHLRDAHAVIVGAATGRVARAIAELVVAHPEWVERLPSA